MRRYIYIGGAVVVLAIVVVVIFLFGGKKSSTPGTSGTTGSLPGVGTQTFGSSTQGGGSGGGLSGIGSVLSGGSGTSGVGAAAKMGIASNETVFSYFVDRQNNIFTVQPDGKIEQIVAGGQSTYLNSSAIENLISADFSYDGKRVLASFGNVTSPQWSVFDIDKKSWSVVSGVAPTAAAWSPSDYKIAYLTKTSSGATLGTLDTSNAKAKPVTLLSLPNQDFEISWKSTTSILLSDRSSAFFSGSVFSFNPKTGVLSGIVLNRVGLEAQWNPDATMGVIIVGNLIPRGGKLGIVDSGGNLLHQMAFLTLPSKCVFNPPPAPVAKTSTSTKPTVTSTATSSAATQPQSTLPGLICAIPRDTASLNGAPLPDSYEQKEIMTLDDIYGIDLITGNVTPLFANSPQSFDASNVKLFSGVFFFVNRYDQKLYAVSL